MCHTSRKKPKNYHQTLRTAQSIQLTLTANEETREDEWLRHNEVDVWGVQALQMKIAAILTLCRPGRPSKGSLKLPWRDVGWLLAGHCHPSCLTRCSSRWTTTAFHREPRLCLHDLSPHRITGLDTHLEKEHIFNVGLQNLLVCLLVTHLNNFLFWKTQFKITNFGAPYSYDHIDSHKFTLLYLLKPTWCNKVKM